MLFDIYSGFGCDGIFQKFLKKPNINNGKAFIKKSV